MHDSMGVPLSLAANFLLPLTRGPWGYRKHKHFLGEGDQIGCPHTGNAHIGATYSVAPRECCVLSVR